MRRLGNLARLVAGGLFLFVGVMAKLAVKAWFRDDFTPADGEILTGVSFDELKRTRANASA